MPASNAILGIVVLITAMGTMRSHAAGVAQAYCSGPPHVNAEKVPAELAAAVAKTFGIDVAAARDGTFVRCVGPKLIACYIGANANLHCSKALTSRTLTGATDWCREHPNSETVPTAAIGNGSIYAWSCIKRRAVAGKIASAADAQGYLADYWEAVQ